MKEKFNQILIRNRPQLVEEMDSTPLLDRLISKHVLTRRQGKSISCIVDPYKQNEAVIDALHRRPDEDFDGFCEALIETEQQAIVDKYLRPVNNITSTNESLETNFGITVRGGVETSVVQQLGTVLRQEMHTPAAVQPSTQTSPTPDQGWKSLNRPVGVEDIVVTPSTEEFYRQHRDQSYRMDGAKRGKCIVICNEDFKTAPPMSDGRVFVERDGAVVDVTNLSALFELLGFQVITHWNLSASKMESVVTDVAEDPSLQDDDCLALCVMSHGQQRTVPLSSGIPTRTECIVGCDGVAMPTVSFIAPFCNDRCPALRNKPRLVIFQACRGDSIDQTDSIVDPPPLQLSLTESEVNLATNLERDLSYSLKDFIIGFPTQSGFRSFRNTAVGSWFINALTRVFAEHACDTDVAAMLRLVNQYVSKWMSHSKDPMLLKGGQCASIQDNLTKQYFHLFPGIASPTASSPSSSSATAAAAAAADDVAQQKSSHACSESTPVEVESEDCETESHESGKETKR